MKAVPLSSPRSTKILSLSKHHDIVKQQLNRSGLSTTSHNRGYLGPNQSTLSSSQHVKVQDSRPSHPEPQNTPTFCKTCRSVHFIGPCITHNEQRCGNCGLAHFAYIRTCPDLCSEIQLRIMLDKSRLDKGLGVDALRAVLRLELARRTQRDRSGSISNDR